MPRTNLAVDFEESKIDAIFSDLDQGHLPGAAVGIAIGGTPVYRKGFGVANIESPVALSPHVRMRIGSTTKHFTALAYLLLCEEGRAGIDDSLGTHLPELHPVSRGVTMRQLMGHQSGLRDAFDINFHLSGPAPRVTSEEIVSFYRDIDDVNAAPGRVWIYNNAGYMLLTAVIERITGQPLESVLRERIFDPVGMYDTLLRRFETDFVPNSATGHMTNVPGAFEKSLFGSARITNAAGMFEKAYVGIASDGCGGVVATVDDMLRWLAHMDAPVIGSKQSWDVLKAPQQLQNGTSTGYGLGLFSERYRGVDTIGHAGGVFGSNAHMLKVPGAALDVVVMVNRHDVIALHLVNGIVDACLPGLDPVQERVSSACVTGTFRSPETGRVLQLCARDGQQIAAINGWELAVTLGEGRVLSPIPALSFYKITLALMGDDPAAAPSAVRLSNFGNLDELIAVEPVGNAEAAPIMGRYLSHSTGTEVTIYGSEAGARLKTAGRFGSVQFFLESIARGVWRCSTRTAVPLTGVLSFADDHGSFRLSTSRTWGLKFQRIGP